MKKILLLLLIFLVGIRTTLDVGAKQKDKIIKNKLFSVSIPAEYKKDCLFKTKRDTISIFHKQSKKAGFGGFAFGLRAYKNPSDHAEMPGGRKIGELFDKKGILYDMVLKYPTDVQYDYTKYSEAPEIYKFLYDYGKNVDITGVNGSEYFKDQGMKGEHLYKDILKKHLIALNEKWDSIRLEKEEMSPMYNVIKDKNKVGYTYFDVNADGIDELLIGEISNGAWKGVIYDMYTMVDRKTKHVVSGWDRNRYFVCDDTFICNEYSSGALESGVRVYILVENTTELFPQVFFKFDGYKNPKNPWFLSYGKDEDEDMWENVSPQKYNERKKVFEKYERFNFIPLTQLNLLDNF